MTADTPLETLFRLNGFQKNALEKMGLRTAADLLYHFPARYGSAGEVKRIAALARGGAAVVVGKISGLKTSKGFRTKIPMAEGTVADETGALKIVWFNQPYLAKMIADGAFVRVEGRVSARRKTGELYMSNPKIEQIGALPSAAGGSLFAPEIGPDTIYPVYPESRGITSNWFYHAIKKIFAGGLLDGLDDPIPQDVLARYNLPSLRTALIWIHEPKRENDAAAARKRFAFEEILLIQIGRQREKREWEAHPAFPIAHADEHLERFVSRFPFPLTAAQRRAIEDIRADFARGRAMARLLEGDVGSGKTAVATATAYAAVTTRPRGQAFGALEVAYMCPTEILARQHFESFIAYFRHLPIQIGLITSSGCRKFPSKTNPAGWTDISRSQLLKWVANGEVPILIGTHALIQKTVRFKNLAYVIIDEQHRFGTAQRQKLVRKDKIAPHLLSMTATPIPRTLALTMYGDLDLSVLDELPPGRKPIITEIAGPEERRGIYEKVREELAAGRQAYVICPRIDEPDPAKELALNARSVKEEAKRLKKEVYPEYEIGILHGKMRDGEKEEVMNGFVGGALRVLVATSVVEVGVNVPNATVIIIEGAERFGLAQLHQLRGRVLRSARQAYCYAFTESRAEKARERLKILRTAKNGFELAEFDLKFRGAGELSGGKQWGVSDIAMEALRNPKLVEAARAEAVRLTAEDPPLARHPLIAGRLAKSGGIAPHFE